MNKKTCTIVLGFIAFTGSAFAVWTSSFTSWDDLTKNSSDIIIARSVATSEPKGVILDHMVWSEIEVMTVLKGYTKPGTARMVSQYTPRQGERFLMFSAFESDENNRTYHATETYRVVPLGLYFNTNGLNGKILEEQIQYVLRQRLDQLNIELKDLADEKNRLEEGNELSLLRPLPQLGRDWSLQKQESKKKGSYDYSWATFTNSKTGDIMSFAADRYANANRSVQSSPVRQAAVDMFPGGLPRFMNDQTRSWRLADTIRFNVVTLETEIDATRENVKTEALEYSYVYEDEGHITPNRLAHGYVLASGGTCIFVQHTSTHVIPSDDAKSTVLSVLRNHPFSRPKQ